MTRVSSWGRLGAPDHEVIAIASPQSARAQVKHSPHPGLGFGAGRSYGDQALNPGGTLWSSRALDRFIAFDGASGRLRCEAGVLLRDIQRALLPRGWMLPVVPGTQIVTVGGAIANDVHGKNHHGFGSFGDHVTRIELVRTDGRQIVCGPETEADWFSATVGGMGLTGFITAAEIQLRRAEGPWLDTETIPFKGLDRFFDLSRESEAGWEHTVSWIDCLAGTRAKGLFLRANPARGMDRPVPRGKARAMPFVPPISLVNQLSLRPFNFAYYHLNALGAGRKIAHYEAYHHPLDAIQHWNRMYGPRGFYQYQSVVPVSAGREATKEMLAAIANSGEGSFLAVLKMFGDRPPVGLLSFPMPGVTLALDFPNRGARTERLFERLDAIVAAAGGRIYAAKDARMPRTLFEAGYPNLETFKTFRDPGISSAMSRRLMGA